MLVFEYLIDHHELPRSPSIDVASQHEDIVDGRGFVSSVGQIWLR
jgi:hypothetical protein